MRHIKTSLSPHPKYHHPTPPTKTRINIYGIEDLKLCPLFSDHPLSLGLPLIGTLRRRRQWCIGRSLYSRDSFNLLVHPHHKKTDFRRGVLTRFRGQGETRYLEAQSQAEGEARASSGRRDYRRTQLSSRFTLR